MAVIEYINTIMKINSLEKIFENVLNKIIEYLIEENAVEMVSGSNQLPIEFIFKGTTVLIIPEFKGTNNRIIAVYSKNQITGKFQKLEFNFDIQLTGHPIEDIKVYENCAVDFLNWLFVNLPFSIIKQ